MTDLSIELLADHLRVGALLDRAVREMLTEGDLATALHKRFRAISINETDVWILLAMTEHLLRRVDRNAVFQRSKSSAAIAAQLGFSRARVGIRIAALIRHGLLKSVSVKGPDRRRKLYQLTALGSRLTLLLAVEVSALERRVLRDASLEMRSRAVDPQRIALGLCGGDLDSAEVRWLDPERLRSRKGNSGRGSLASPSSAILT